MRIALLTLILSTIAWGKPTVLVSYFNPFGKEPVNNSETVAKLVLAKAEKLNLPYEIKLCRTQTKFDVSFDELRNCVKAMAEVRIMVVGLGETGCDVKIELMARNLDRTKGPDNAGEERNNTPIVPDAPEVLGFTYPLAEMYCSLPDNERLKLIVSNSAGSFVCNNLAYQAAWFEDDLSFGFIHVPNHNCNNLAPKNEKAALVLLTMFMQGAEISMADTDRPRLPVKKAELDILRKEFAKTDKCLSEFYKRARGHDEKRWNIFN